MTTVMDGHIVVDDHGVARIEGTRIKVMQLVMALRSECKSAEELHDWYPHLKQAAIYAALAYYHDHREKIDAQIQESTSSRIGCAARIRIRSREKNSNSDGLRG